MLSQYPAILQKLREKVLEHVGANRMPTYDDIRSMKYLRAVLNGGFFSPRSDGTSYLSSLAGGLAGAGGGA